MVESAGGLLDRHGRRCCARTGANWGGQHQGQVIVEPSPAMGQQQLDQAVQGLVQRRGGEAGFGPVVQLELTSVGRSGLHQPVGVQQQPILTLQPDLLDHRGWVQAQRRGWLPRLQQPPPARLD